MSDASLKLGEPGRVVPDLSVAPSGRIHVIAAGGAAMSAICHILGALGWQVTGSDQAASDAVGRLVAKGMRIDVGHQAHHVHGAALVIVSTAVKAGNPEYDEAVRLGLPIAGRQEVMEALGRLRTTLAISGTHGKTTTSAMAASVAAALGLDPSFIVGGVVNGLDTGVQWANSSWLVVEADESDNSFLRFQADHVIVTNIEPDHLDFHGSMAQLEAAFDQFALQGRGRITVCGDDPGALALVHRVSASATVSQRLCTYGFAEGVDYRVVNANSAGLRTTFSLQLRGEWLCDVELGVPGLHNASNATAVFAAWHQLGFDPSRLAAALGSFQGVGRRFEFRGSQNGITFVDDYAHLPTEVATVLAAARAGGWNRIVAVFQPHRYTRIRDVGKDFADSFVNADHVVITDLYAAGQQPIAGIDSSVVVNAIRAAHPQSAVHLVEGRAAQIEHLVSALQPGDLCLTMNAGDLTTLPDELLVALSETS
jgi:UDP-N-acetylmuramate--alanine ligase